MLNANIQLETLTCPSCLIKIENAVGRLEGVRKDSVRVMFNASKVKLNFDNNLVSIEDIENVIINLGYGVIKSIVK